MPRKHGILPTEDLTNPVSPPLLLGILGGMGPQATSYFYDQLIQNTPTQTDEGHIPAIIYSNTQIPSRQLAIKEMNYVPVVQSMKNSLELLIHAGADYLVIPCNTAHFFIDQINPPPTKPIIHIIKEARDYFLHMLTHFPDQLESNDIGIFATTGLTEVKWYEHYFQPAGFTIHYPPPKIQKMLHEAIFQIKANQITPDLLNSVKKSMEVFRSISKVKWIILACTELSVLFKNQQLEPLFLFDPLLQLIKVCVQRLAPKSL